MLEFFVGLGPEAATCAEIDFYVLKKQLFVDTIWNGTAHYELALLH